MTRITEDYVSFEIAKLLKEKGFDTPVWTRYENDDDGNKVIFGDKYNWNNSPMGQISAPTHQMAMKWLREVHKIYIEIVHFDKDRHTYYLYRYYSNQPERCVQHKNPIYSTYEKTCEAAIKYCLGKISFNYDRRKNPQL